MGGVKRGVPPGKYALLAGGETFTGNVTHSDNIKITGGKGIDYWAGGAQSGRVYASTSNLVIYGVANRGLWLGVNNDVDAIKINTDKVFLPWQAVTGSAPTYVKGGIYFDTTLNKLRVGGASAWETITST